jgi:hypothetical protein
MPRGDRTGPLGQGPQTGRGLGPSGTGIEENPDLVENIGFPRKLGSGLGIGRGIQRQGRKTGGSQGRRRGGQGQGRNR